MSTDPPKTSKAQREATKRYERTPEGREKTLARKRRYVATHQEQITANVQEWRGENPERYREANRRNAAKRRRRNKLIDNKNKFSGYTIAQLKEMCVLEFKGNGSEIEKIDIVVLPAKATKQQIITTIEEAISQWEARKKK